MESTVHAHNTETASVWTDEKHVNFLNTMEASFVRTMLHRRQDAPSNNRHHHLRLDRHLPDSAESTLDSKPRTSCKIKKHAPSDSTGSRARIASRRMRRRTSAQLRNSSQQPDQEVPQLENGREDASCVAGHHDKDQTSYS
ncbi:uncharacterized protein LOC130716658 [Lotus japonicus]|uniref:uncharacterized protein LOC130716658 n=1 Tax=Lotus japonicus TaxID=34305 RepID=UPI002582684B|nr:uncharacterized protein LOC130716658 [Lotus japonicus]